MVDTIAVRNEIKSLAASTSSSSSSSSKISLHEATSECTEVLLKDFVSRGESMMSHIDMMLYDYWQDKTQGSFYFAVSKSNLSGYASVNDIRRDVAHWMKAQTHLVTEPSVLEDIRTQCGFWNKGIRFFTSMSEPPPPAYISNGHFSFNDDVWAIFLKSIETGHSLFGFAQLIALSAVTRCDIVVYFINMKTQIPSFIKIPYVLKSEVSASNGTISICKVNKLYVLLQS